MNDSIDGNCVRNDKKCHDLNQFLLKTCISHLLHIIIIMNMTWCFEIRYLVYTYITLIRDHEIGFSITASHTTTQKKYWTSPLAFESPDSTYISTYVDVNVCLPWGSSWSPRWASRPSCLELLFLGSMAFMVMDSLWLAMTQPHCQDPSLPFTSIPNNGCKSLSCVQLFVTLWTVAHQAPLSVGFSRPEYWSGLPFPSPGDLPDPGIEPGSPTLQADSLPAGKAIYLLPPPPSKVGFALKLNWGE